jgi:5'(3')-deoxyribonucleotidase
MTKIALIDLDGTLADYDGALRVGLCALAGPGEDIDYIAGMGFTRESYPPWLRVREAMVRSMPGYYLNLPPIDEGFVVLEVLKELGFSLHVATKAPSHNTAIASMEKIQWCAKYLPGVPVTISGDKSLLRGEILFDDWPGYIDPWLKANPEGLALVPSQPWNSEWESCAPERTLVITPELIIGQIKDFIRNHESRFLV